MLPVHADICRYPVTQSPAHLQIILDRFACVFSTFLLCFQSVVNNALLLSAWGMGGQPLRGLIAYNKQRAQRRRCREIGLHLIRLIPALVMTFCLDALIAQGNLHLPNKRYLTVPLSGYLSRVCSRGDPQNSQRAQGRRQLRRRWHAWVQLFVQCSTATNGLTIGEPWSHGRKSGRWAKVAVGATLNATGEWFC